MCLELCVNDDIDAIFAWNSRKNDWYFLEIIFIIKFKTMERVKFVIVFGCCCYYFFKKVKKRKVVKKAMHDDIGGVTDDFILVSSTKRALCLIIY